MPPSIASDPQRVSRISDTLCRCAAGSLTRLLGACLARVRTVALDLVGCDEAAPARPHVTLITTLIARGWRVGEIRPSADAPARWRVTGERYDGAVSITVTDAADPDAALEELARYAAADAEEER